MAEREILFRGKIINCDLVVSKEWIYGSYCDEAKSPIRLKGEKDYTLCPHISKYDPHYYLKEFGNLGAPYFYEVHPKTVGQYTGLKDKNGVRIFEGDIIKADNGHIGYVAFSKGGFVKACRCHSNFTDLYSDNQEVIGNIHDNPELLKGEN